MINTIWNLQQEDRSLHAKQVELHNRSVVEKRAFSTGEQAEWDELKAQRARIKTQLDAELARERSDRSGSVIVPTGGGAWERPAYDAGKAVFKPTGRRYRDLFPNAALSSNGFRDFNEFCNAWHVSSQQFDPRLRAAQTEDSFSTGGALVPEEYAAQILENGLENSIVWPRATVWPMSSEVRKVPGFDGFDHTANLYGGFAAQWVGEGETLTPQDVKTRLIQLTAHKLALMGNASNELIADAVGGFGAVYGAAMQAAVAWWMDWNFLNGSGAGQPKGVLNDPALISVAKEGSQPGATIVYENVTKMFSRLHPACVPNSVWVCNSTCIPQLLQMQLKVWNADASAIVGGSATPVVSQQGGQMTLLTRPILLTEKLPQLGAKGDLILVDFSQYAIGLRRGMALEQSGHAGFLTDSVYFRVLTRCDGQGTWKSAVTPKNGLSLSWAVTLDART